MIPLNYSTHFREWYEQQEWLEGIRRQPVDLAYKLIKKAQIFRLPDGGRLLDKEGKLLSKYAPLCHLPFQLTAFEFQATSRKEISEKFTTFKRIALCFDSVILKHLRIQDAQDDEFGCMSIFYHVFSQTWQVLPCISIISRSKVNVIDETIMEDFVRQKKEAEVGGYDFHEMKNNAIGTECMRIAHIRFLGYDEFTSGALQMDARDEIIAAVQACAAISCNNIIPRKIDANAALNKKRARSNRIPFSSYYILELTNERMAAGPNQGGTHSSPRQHLRRGHIRHLASGKTTWVNSAVIGSKAAGQVHKDYAL